MPVTTVVKVVEPEAAIDSVTLKTPGADLVKVTSIERPSGPVHSQVRVVSDLMWGPILRMASMSPRNIPRWSLSTRE